jgi:hypothetical protein
MHSKGVANNTCATKVQQQHMRALKDQQQHMHNKGASKQSTLMRATTYTHKKFGMKSFNRE